MLSGAVIVKQFYQHMWSVVKTDAESVQYEERFPDLEQFDDDLRKMLEVTVVVKEFL